VRFVVHFLYISFQNKWNDFSS